MQLYNLAQYWTYHTDILSLIPVQQIYVLINQEQKQNLN